MTDDERDALIQAHSQAIVGMHAEFEKLRESLAEMVRQNAEWQAQSQQQHEQDMGQRRDESSRIQRNTDKHFENVERELRAKELLAESMKRIADALERKD